MMDWLFKFMMHILVVIVIAGVIAFVAWKIAAFIAILAILSPFALAIYLMIIRKIKSTKGVANG